MFVYTSIGLAYSGRTTFSLNISWKRLQCSVWMGIIFAGLIFSMSSLSSGLEACPETCLRVNIFCLPLNSKSYEMPKKSSQFTILVSSISISSLKGSVDAETYLVL